MNTTSSKGPLLLIIVGVLALIVAFVVKPILFDKKQRATSDSAKSSELITVAGDGYIGYWFIDSPEMRMMAPRNGIEINFIDDGGAYDDRLKKLDDDEYDCIVLPISSYLEHGPKYNYPGVVVAAISESKGADALVGPKGILSTGKINDLNNPNLRIAYTDGSPSSFLLDLTISDFDLDQLSTNDAWRQKVNSSEEAYAMAKKNRADSSMLYVMWEPEVSKAVEDLGLEAVWGSDQFAGYIIDVFVFSREFISKKPEAAQRFLRSYFRVLDRYASNKDKMIKEMSKSTDLKKAVVEKMIKKIDWFTLQENCAKYFGISVGVGDFADDRIISAIIACSDVMERVGTVKQAIRDPYRIVNSSFLETLSQSAVRAVGDKSAPDITFSVLSDGQWAALDEIGTMRIEPINFQSGNNRLDESGKGVVDRVALMLANNYPSYRIAIRGHTGTGDPQANAELSLERAEVVMQRLIAVHGIDTNRLHSEGLGATQPPKRKPGESTRSLRFRMPRVEFVLLEGSSL